MNPLGRVFDNSRAYHVHIDVYNATKQVLPAFYNCCVISILPEGSFAPFANIVFLSAATKIDGNMMKNGQEQRGKRDGAPSRSLAGSL